jgi:hypothetical protein
MRKRVTGLLVALSLLIMVCAYAAAEAGVPSIDDKLFKGAKQTLVYFDAGDFDSAAGLLGFADAGELSEFAEIFTALGGGVQTTVSVAYWTGSDWALAVPLSAPGDAAVEALVLHTADGKSFSGCSYADWGQVETAYAACNYVVWNEEYISNTPRIIEDN